MVDPENPWVFTLLSIAVWVGVQVSLEATLFEGNLPRAAMSGVVGGIAFSTVFVLGQATERYL